MTTTTIEYVGQIQDWKLDPVPRRGMMQLLPGQGPDGYGRKISTDRKIKVDDRWYRVYAICFSNAASHYIIKGGKNLYVRDCDFPTKDTD